MSLNNKFPGSEVDLRRVRGVDASVDSRDVTQFSVFMSYVYPKLALELDTEF